MPDNTSIARLLDSLEPRLRQTQDSADPDTLRQLLGEASRALHAAVAELREAREALVAERRGDASPGEADPFRMLFAASPDALLVTDGDGALAGLLGTMGGDSQPQILLQLLARLLHNGQTPADAVAAGRWVLTGPEGGAGFDTWDNDGQVRVAIEGHAPDAWEAGLRARGHTTVRTDAYNHGFGHAHVIVNRGDHLSAAADPRALSGAAAGY